MHIVAGPALEFPPGFDANAKDLIEGLLTHDPQKRKVTKTMRATN